MSYSAYCKEIKEALDGFIDDYNKELTDLEFYHNTTEVSVIFPPEYFDFQKLKSELSKDYHLISYNNLDDSFYLEYMGMTCKFEYIISKKRSYLEISFIEIDEDDYLLAVSMSEDLV